MLCLHTGDYGEGESEEESESEEEIVDENGVKRRVKKKKGEAIHYISLHPSLYFRKIWYNVLVRCFNRMLI